jgi:tetratricopeptide (TPR) repeat protein
MRWTNDEERREQLRREADQIAVALHRYPDYGLAHFTKALYFEWLGLDEQAREEWEKGVDVGGGSWRFAIFLYGTGEQRDVEKAISLLDECRDSDRITRAILQAEMPGGRQHAIDSMRDLAENTKYEGVLASALGVLYFLGECKLAREISERRRQSPQFGSPWKKAMIEFLADGAAERLSSEAKGHYQLCAAHFTIALMYLGEGNRSQAERHFKACLDTRIPFAYCRWSKAFLRRMENPAWPPWIEFKEQNEPPSEKAKQ